MIQINIKTKIIVSLEINHHEASRYYKDNALRNQQSSLPLLWAKVITRALEVVGGCGEDKLEVEGATARAEVVGVGAKVEAIVGCLLTLPLVACHCGGGGCYGLPIYPSKRVSTRSAKCAFIRSGTPFFDFSSSSNISTSCCKT